MNELTRRRFVTLLGMGLVVGPQGLARASALVGARVVHQETVSLHIDIDGTAGTPSLFTLDSPPRLVIDLPDTVAASSMDIVEHSSGPVSRIRHGQQAGGVMRVVVDLRRSVSPSYRLVERGSGHRLLVDLGVKGDPALARSSHRVVEGAPLRDAIVAIDAGHGGKDPGAIGQRQTREKDVTLSVARRLFRRLSATHGVTPVMIRDSDTYIALRDRIRAARDKNADVFVSIHADAFKRLEARGSSVYALSRDGATSEAAAWLAKSKNESAALFGDVALDGLEPTLRQTLLDLAQNTTLEASMDVGAEVLSDLKRIGAVHKPQVEQANFAVLKSPDIPSVLVETAFISNLQEEKKLNDPGYQRQLASAIGDGVARYLARRAPDGTLLAAERRHAAGQG
jgi:N-acetylmuramoyl-L-alanine amidase